MSQVPKVYEEEYRTQLKDPIFRNDEIRKSLGTAATVKASSSFVDYMTKSDVIRVVDSLDNSANWSAYISNPLSDKMVATACAVITKSAIVGTVAGVLTWTTSWVMSKQESWWKDSAVMILKKQITGVKLTVTPNNTGSNYPAAYITLTRYYKK